MADNAVVHIGENSPEQVALKLLQAVAASENMNVPPFRGGDVHADRKWILDAYTECLEAVKGYRQKPKQWPSQG